MRKCTYVIIENGVCGDSFILPQFHRSPHSIYLLRKLHKADLLVITMKFIHKTSHYSESLYILMSLQKKTAS